MAHIQKRGENSYRIIVSKGYDINGKKIPAMKTVRLDPSLPPKKQEAELNRLSVEFEQEVKNGKFLDGSKITFAEFSARWMKEYAEQELERKTVRRYRDLLDSRILPAIGHFKMDKLQPTHLISFYNNLREAGIRLDEKFIAKEKLKEMVKNRKLTLDKLAHLTGLTDWTVGNALRGKKIMYQSAEKIAKALNVKLKTVFALSGEPRKLSSNTVHHHHTLISSILNDAVEWQIITDSPAARVPVPKVDKKIPKHYNKKQAMALIDALAAESIKYRTMVLLDAFTGLRSGEFMGLDWTDVDLEARTVTITKVSQYISGEGTFTKDKPKNDHSVRVISFPPFISAVLKVYKEWWEEQRLACGDLWQGSNRLFVSWDGRPLYTYALANWMPAFLERHNLPPLTPHGLRHTCASLLAKKIPIPDLAKLLGHGKPSTTSDIYVHFLQDENSEAADLLEDMLIPKQNTITEQE